MITYLGGRNIAMFSTDLNSFDFKIKNAGSDRCVGDEQAQEGRQGHHPDARLPARHRPGAARAAGELKANGYKVVALTAKTPITTLPEYDAMMSQEIKGATANARPTASVVRTVSEGN